MDDDDAVEEKFKEIAAIEQRCAMSARERTKTAIQACELLDKSNVEYKGKKYEEALKFAMQSLQMARDTEDTDTECSANF